MYQALPFSLPFLEQGLKKGQALDPSLAVDKNTVHHGRDLETWHLEAGRHLGTSEADTEVGFL